MSDGSPLVPAALAPALASLLAAAEGSAGLALLAGGIAWRLPPGAQPVAPPLLRPAPAAAPGLLGIALLGAQAVPAFAPPDCPPGPVWVTCVLPQGLVLISGEALLDPAPADARPFLMPGLVGSRAEALAEPLPAAAPRAAAAIRRQREPALVAQLSHGEVALPLAEVERILATGEGAAAPVPLPGSPPGLLGLAMLAGAPALVLDPAWVAGVAAEAGAVDAGAGDAGAPLMLVLRHAGGRYALPCHRVAPADADEAMLTARLDSPQAAAMRALAPPAIDPPAPQPVAMRDLLLLRIGGQRLAMPLEEVASVIPPIRPVLAPRRDSRGAALVAHRGEVLPALDGGLCIGAAALLRDGVAVPLLRLAGAVPTAVAVEGVDGLRRVPLADIALLPPGDPALPPALVTAVATLAGLPVPVLAAAGLLARGAALAARAGGTPADAPTGGTPADARPGVPPADSPAGAR